MAGERARRWASTRQIQARARPTLLVFRALVDAKPTTPTQALTNRRKASSALLESCVGARRGRLSSAAKPEGADADDEIADEIQSNCKRVYFHNGRNGPTKQRPEYSCRRRDSLFTLRKVHQVPASHLNSSTNTTVYTPRSIPFVAFGFLPVTTTRQHSSFTSYCERWEKSAEPTCTRFRFGASSSALASP